MIYADVEPPSQSLMSPSHEQTTGTWKVQMNADHMPPTIRFRILSRVNGILGILLVAFFAYEYHRAVEVRRSHKHEELEEEAQLIADSAERLVHDGTNAIQQYIDAVCRQMPSSSSPGHHVVVRLPNDVLQAQRRASSELVEVMLRAESMPDDVPTYRGDALIIGSGTQVTVHTPPRSDGGR